MANKPNYKNSNWKKGSNSSNKWSERDKRGQFAKGSGPQPGKNAPDSGALTMSDSFADESSLTKKVSTPREAMAKFRSTAGATARKTVAYLETLRQKTFNTITRMQKALSGDLSSRESVENAVGSLAGKAGYAFSGVDWSR